MNSDSDTIAAIATAPGRGGVGIVRISGAASGRIAAAVLGHCPAPRRAVHLPFRDARGAVVDEGIALFFAGPHSFTGEDVLELQGHGGPVVLDLLLAAVLGAGARLAEPGEFSRRAFLNGRLDLAQAEAVADLIEAGSAQAARAALHSLQGAFSQRVQTLTTALIELRTLIEGAIDFPDEGVDFLADYAIGPRLEAMGAQLAELHAGAHQGSLLREGMTLVIAGRPNAGKSSLLNALAGYEAAIVTDIPGTTRDVLRERIALDGMPLHILDTAGLRESTDRVEQEGVRRAWAEIGRADLVLLVVDDREGIGAAERDIAARLPAGPALTVVRNKIDLSGRAPARTDGPLGPEVSLSARSGAGLDLLRQHLKACMGYQTEAAGGFMARRRHLDALRRAGEHLAAATRRVHAGEGIELAAEELRLAQQVLGEITGEFTSEDLLGVIFSQFCIGK